MTTHLTNTLIVSMGLIAACGGHAAEERTARNEKALSLDAAAASPAMAPSDMARSDMAFEAPLRRVSLTAAAAPAPREVARMALPAQMLIRTADLRIQVASIAAALQAVDSLATSNSALIADSRQSHDIRGASDAHVVIRVPSTRFATALADLRRIGDVKGEMVNADDITKAYADLETRLGVKEETVTRLRGLLATRTAKLSDVLEVERELSRAVTELEQMKGERRFDEQQVAMASISVQFFERELVHQSAFTAAAGDAFQRAVVALESSVASLIYVVTFLVPWIAIVAAGWWLARSRRLSRIGVRAP